MDGVGEREAVSAECGEIQPLLSRFCDIDRARGSAAS